MSNPGFGIRFDADGVERTTSAISGLVGQLRMVRTELRAAAKDAATFERAMRGVRSARVPRSGGGTRGARSATSAPSAPQMNTGRALSAVALPSAGGGGGGGSSPSRIAGEARRASSALGEMGSRGQRAMGQQITQGASMAGGAVSSLRSSITGVTGAIGLMGVAIAAINVSKIADEITGINNRLRLVTNGADEQREVYARLESTADSTRTSLNATAELYLRLANAGKELQLSQDKLISVTETINQALKISGATGQEAEAGLIQFAQGLAAGKLNGDELRSVLEQIPVLADIIAEEFDTTRGKLRDLGADGKLTSDRIIKAILTAGPKIQAQFSTTTSTIGDSVTLLQNQFTKLVKKFDETFGASKFVVGIIQLLTENMETLIIAAAGVAGAMALLVVVTSPLTPIILGIAAAAALLAEVFRRDVGGIRTFFVDTFEKAKLFFQGIVQLFKEGGFSGAVQEELAKAENSGVKQFAIRVFQIAFRVKRAFMGFVEGVSSGFAQIKPSIDRVVDALGSMGDAFGLVSKKGGKELLPSQEFFDFGKRVGEVVVKVIGFAADVFATVGRIRNAVFRGFSQTIERFRPVFTAFYDSIMQLGSAIATFFKGTSDEVDDTGSGAISMAEKVGSVVAFIATAFVKVATLITDVATKIVGAFTWIRDSAKGVTDAIVTIIEGTLSLIEGLVGAIMTVVDEVYTVVNNLRKAYEFVSDILSREESEPLRPRTSTNVASRPATRQFNPLDILGNLPSVDQVVQTTSNASRPENLDAVVGELRAFTSAILSRPTQVQVVTPNNEVLFESVARGARQDAEASFRSGPLPVGGA